MTINLFFVGVELFTGIYSDMPHHLHTFEFLYLGLEGHTSLVPWMWTNAVLTVVCVALLLTPATRRREGLLAVTAVGVIAAIWIEKGMGMVVGGFTPSPLREVTEYAPTLTEIGITVGVYALGFAILTALSRIVVNVREKQIETARP
ncbi:MAG: menaquinol oxidoreductase, partial [Pseudomonadales bacterium]|nr:menaquinol oxidoreductase [Pseudomonadales bacterium]NIX07219.1 menaquinol oxidoreductase [Pseudomonadales bacterium]